MASAQSHWLVQRGLAIQPLGYLVVLGTKILPFLFLCLCFTFVYKFIPYTQVNLSSAFVGGLSAGILWNLAGMAFAAFVAESGNYSAVYSSFAVLILFLIWLYVGWLIVLAGAQVAYYHQNPSAYLMQLRWKQDTHAFREHLALSILLLMTRRFLAGQPPLQELELSRSFNVPLSLVEDLLKELIPSGIIMRTSEPEGVALGQPPEQIRVVDILDLLGKRQHPSMSFPGPEGNEVSMVLHRRDRAVRMALDTVTLRSLELGADSGEQGTVEELNPSAPMPIS
jgi:membrane protein